MIPDYPLPSAQRRDDGGACVPPPPPPPPLPSVPYPQLHHHPHPQPQMPPVSPPPPVLINTECLPEGMSSEDATAICDFDRLVRHRDFGKILSSAARLKNLQCQGSSDPALNPAAKNPGIMNLALSDLHSEKAANIVRENTCTAVTTSSALSASSPLSVLPRGLFPYTDALVDETVSSLVAELDRCLSIAQTSASASNATDNSGDDGAPSAKKTRRKPPKGKKKAGGNASQSIAVKYSKQQTDILTEWMIQNRSHPFPDQNQIHALSEAAGLTYSQVVNWTTNVRKRNLKATVDHGKKPHHFLDFLFLADDREKKQLGGEPLKASTSLGVTKKGRKNTSTTSPASRRRQANSTKSRSKARNKTSQAKSKHQHQYESDLMTMNEEEMPPLETTVAVPPPLVPSAPFFPHPNMLPPNPLPPPLPGKFVLPYPPMPYHHQVAAPFHHQGAYPPHSAPPGGGRPHSNPAARGATCMPPPMHPYPRPPPAPSSQPFPMDMENGTALAGNISPSYQHTEMAGTYHDAQTTITPSSSTSPTESRRNTGDSLEEALNFWNSSDGLFSSEDIRNDAVLQGPVDDVERMAIQKATEGGLVSTPPRAEDEEETGVWLGENDDGDILKSFEANGGGCAPLLPDGGSLKRPSISDAAMLPMARNEKARRLSSLGTTLQSLGYNPEIFTSAMSDGPQQHHQLQMDDPPFKRLSDMSLPKDYFADAISTPLPLDNDGLVREILEENGAAVQI